MDNSIIQRLSEICGNPYIFTDQETREAYGHDETENLNFPPTVVVKPGSTQEVSQIMALADEFSIPVTPIGGRTGLSGGILCVHGGIALSTERLNRILDIDEQNLQVTTEPGVITQVLQETLLEKGLFYPVDPSSRGSCFIGGNVAENAGGARAVKYGVTKDYVLNLEVVLPDGNVIMTGANTLKNATGYNLTQLMVGSEGTLGIVTRIVLRLLQAQKHTVLLLVPFYKEEEACMAVSAIFRAGVTPSALEFMERDAIDWTLKYVDGVSIAIDEEVAAHLLIEVDGNYPDVLQEEAERIMEVLEKYAIGEVLYADTEEQKNALWKLRRAVGEAVKSHSVYREVDTVVPRYELPALLKVVKETGKRYGFHSVCYGHAGDGNLHVNIIRGEMTDYDWNEKVPRGISEIFKFTVSLGGTLSGEHGIGYVQKNYMPIAFDKHSLRVMKAIKAVFDPKGILNPGKIFPED